MKISYFTKIVQYHFSILDFTKQAFMVFSQIVTKYAPVLE
jgi:hypothetical protein